MRVRRIHAIQIARAVERETRHQSRLGKGERLPLFKRWFLNVRKAIGR